MKNFTWVMLVSALLLSLNVVAQNGAPVKQEQIQVGAPQVVNFKQLAEYEAQHPVKMPQRDVERDEDDESHQVVPNHNAIGAGATVANINLNTKSNTRAASPAPNVTFTGLTDNSTVIPPDVDGAAGTNYVMETINSQFAIFSKTGTNVSTITITTFFSASGSSDYYDPHIEYDPYSSRWLITMAATLSTGHAGFVLAASQTSDPTGNWYEYSVDAQGTTKDWMDYPTLGFNSNWVVVCGNMFTSSSNTFANAVVFVMNKAGVYSGSAGTVNQFSDASVFTLQPAVTYDNTIATEYMITDWNGNSGGNGYVRLYTITGTATAPVYTAGNEIGVNQPWSESSVGAPQLGSTKTITTNDARILNSVYRNGSLYFAQNAFLPASAPKRTSVQWWQINPSASTVTQFGRVDDATGATFYAFPSISVNSNNDVLVGYSVFSKTIYASSGYSFRTSSDPVNTLETNNTFKSGLSSYYKTYGGSSNRWGDYSFTCVDPTDNSLWTIQEFAYTPANQWGTVWANLPASSTVSCGLSSGLNATNITSNSATLNWGAVSGATSYNVQYQIVGASTWTSTSSSTNTVNITGLSASSNYQFEVETVCSGGLSTYTAATGFSTPAPPCSVTAGLNVTNLTSSSVTLNWGAVSGAVSYNVQYQIVGASTWTTGSSATNSLNVTGLTASSNYQFEVQTVCSGNSAVFSAATSFSTPAPPCSVTSGLNVTNLTSSSVTLNWGAVSGAVSYNVQYQVVGASTWTTGSSATNSLNISGLSLSTNYQFEVQTVCSGNSAVFSAATSFSTPAPPCSVTSGLNVTNLTSSSATLNWGAVSGALSYNVQYQVVGASTWTTGSSATNSLNISGLTASSNYQFEVQTVCSGSSVAFSAATSFSTPAPPCTVASGLSTSNLTSSSVTLNWGAVSGAASYNVQYQVVGASTWTSASSGTNSLNVTGLTASSNYQFEVQTVCSANSATFSAAADFTTPAPPCTVASGLSTSNLTSSSVTLNWGAVSGAASYNVQYQVVGASTWTSASSGTNSLNVTGLTASTNYQFEVQTVCSANSATFSAAATFTTPAPPCSVPSGLGSSNITTTSATVSWGAVSGAVSYNVQYKVSTATTWTVISGVTSNSASLSGLTAAITYNFEVETVCSGSSSAYSAASSFSTTSGTVTYCTDKGNSQSFEYIKSVAFGSFSNVSGSNGGYGNFTNLTIPLTSSGSATTFTLTPGYTGAAYNEYFVIYIDYNGNGVFTDAGEKVYVSGAARAAINGTFTVPSGLNITTRMRIIMQYGSAVTSPCGTYAYGETEDYTVNISPSNAANSPLASTSMMNNTLLDDDNGSTSAIYPNPTSQMVNIILSPVENVQPKIEIISVTGQTMITYFAGEMEEEARINVAALPAGIYLVRTTYGSDRVSTEKLSKIN